MVSFCGYVEGFRDPNIVASLSYDGATREFETILRNSRVHMQGMQRLLGLMKKGRQLLKHVPVMSQDRRFKEFRIQSVKIDKAIDWINTTRLCRAFDRNVLPFAFAFAREQARVEKGKEQEKSQTNHWHASEQDMHVNARLARFMAHDWLSDTGNVSNHPLETHVMKEMAQVQTWIDIRLSMLEVGNDRDQINRQTWQSACLVPILKWEESLHTKRTNVVGDIVSSTAPEYSSVPNDAIWSLAIHPGGVEAWLKSLVKIGYVPVQAPISSSGSTSTSVLDAAQSMQTNEENAVPAPLSISHAILSSTLSQLPAFLTHTNQRTLKISRPGARASKEAAALKATARANLEEEQRMQTLAEGDEEVDEEDQSIVNVASLVHSDLQQFSSNWKHMKQIVPQNLASLFNQALATPFLSTSSSAAKKRRKWLQDAVTQDSVNVTTFHTMHVNHLEDPPSTFAVVRGETKNRLLQPIPKQLLGKRRQRPEQNDNEPATRNNIEPATRNNIESATRNNIEPATRNNIESATRNNIESATRNNIESVTPSVAQFSQSSVAQLSQSSVAQFSQSSVAQFSQPIDGESQTIAQGSSFVAPQSLASRSNHSIDSQQIIHELQIELNAKGWSEASSSSCCYLTSHDTCDICHIPMEQATDLPIQVCPLCQSTRMTLSQYGKQEENTPFSKYVRKAHFRTYMQQVQYQEQTDIDIEDIWRVANFLAARGFDSTNGTVGDVRWALLELKMNKCYNHVTQIYCRIFNKPPPRFTPDQKQILFDMFDAIQDPYFSAPNKGRSNFLSYQVVIYKSCEIQGWKKFLPYFKMLKGDQNIITHDIIWKYICEKRDWPFIRTLSIQYKPPTFVTTFEDPLLKARGIQLEPVTMTNEEDE